MNISKEQIKKLTDDIEQNRKNTRRRVWLLSAIPLILAATLLGYTVWQIQISSQKLEDLQTKLNDTTRELTDTNSSLQDTEVRLNDTQQNLDQTIIDLEVTQDKLKSTTDELNNTKE
jgi:uncharacterized protein HemX